MTDRGDAWWAGKALALKAKELTDTGRAVRVYVRGREKGLAVSAVEISNHVVKLTPTDAGSAGTLHVAKDALVMVEDVLS